MQKNNDGQHRSVGNSSAPGVERGMRGIRNPAAEVGNECGAAANMRVPATKKDSDINTTTNSAGPLAYGEKPGADDNKSGPK